MIESGIVQAASFPLVIQGKELIVECSKHYNANTRQIVAQDGKVSAFLSKAAISEAFNIPDHKDMVYKNKEGAQANFDDGLDKCLGIINKYWISKARSHPSKMPNKLYIINFKEKYSDLITLLNQIMGSLQASPLRIGCSTTWKQ